MAGQAEQVLGQLGDLLAKAGSDKSKVLTATVYITDMALKPEMNRGVDRLVRRPPADARHHRRRRSRAERADRGGVQRGGIGAAPAEAAFR